MKPNPVPPFVPSEKPLYPFGLGAKLLPVSPFVVNPNLAEWHRQLKDLMHNQLHQAAGSQLVERIAGEEQTLDINNRIATGQISLVQFTGGTYGFVLVEWNEEGRLIELTDMERDEKYPTLAALKDGLIETLYEPGEIDLGDSDY